MTNLCNECFKILLSPASLIFLMILIGFYFGKVKLMGASFDLSGVLIVSVLTGAALSFNNTAREILYSDDFTNIMNFISSFGTAFFISSVAVSSGYEFSLKKTNPIGYAVLGAISVVFNFMIAFIISAMDKNASPPFLYGVFCGAMTSTPGLAALIEEQGNAAAASVGYAGSYLIGALAAILFVQIALRREEKISEGALEKEKSNNSASGSASLYGIIQLSAVIVAGSVIGATRIGKSGVSLGVSGGVLLCGIIFGAIAAARPVKKMISRNILSAFRALGLMMFFVGNGVTAGMKLLSALSLPVLLYSLIFACFPIAFGYLALRYFMKKSKYKAINAVCGIMTSTPAFGVFTNLTPYDKHDESAYSAAYAGSLAAMVVTMRIVS